MASTPRPSSPTSLLWAHQLKREHGYLLSRIQQLECSTHQQEDRIKKAEVVANRTTANEGEVKALAEQVKALDDSGGVKERLAKIERDVMAKLEDVEAGNAAMVLKVAELEKDRAQADEEKRKGFTKEKALLKRVGEVEENLKEYEKFLHQLNRKVDENSIDHIKMQLGSLAQQVNEEGSSMKMLDESIKALEVAHEELRKANERLNQEIMKLAPKPAEPPHDIAAPSDPSVSRSSAGKKFKPRPPAPKRAADLDEVGEAIDLPKPKKKSHKWAGGGADRDIIRQASEITLEETDRPARRISTPRRPSHAPPMKARSTTKVTKTKAKAVTKPRTTHKAATKPVRKSDSQMLIKEDPDRPIIRSGKGWVEVAVSTSESESDSPGNGFKACHHDRPHRSFRQDTLDEIGFTSQRITRGARQQLSLAKSGTSSVIPQKREAEPGQAADLTHEVKPSKVTKTVNSSQKEAVDAGADMEENITYSPLSSNPTSPEASPAAAPSIFNTFGPQKTSEKAPPEHTEALEEQPVPVVSRRQIIQYADEAGQP
ncbi:hypothetical protein M433DRAFT_140554 [Acidomyces richmondensis BFW]|nr:MAG: hypothetical protein FE78DRAFT_74360 [Acidomyces sp. 'richmondensis']KYG48946.1 hypothetical protein M433DRAFT_140554 [Acidomyces richmondensis BFW]